MKRLITHSISLIFFLALSGCFTVKISTKGINIPANIKTFSVQYFDNRAKLVEPSFSQTFTDELIEYIEKNSGLRYVNGMGDVDFSGTITTYETSAQAITESSSTSGTLAAVTRFTIGVKFDYMDTKDPEQDFNKSVSAYRDFESTESFSSVEESLSDEIREEIIEAIFTEAFVNW